MSHFGVLIVASLTPSEIFQERKTEPKMEEVKRQYRPYPLQQFFTRFTNSNITLGNQYRVIEQASAVIKMPNARQKSVLPPSGVYRVKIPQLVLSIKLISKVATAKTISAIVRIGSL
jgi:translation initiation factor RLI1